MPDLAKIDGLGIAGSMVMYGACEHPENALITVDEKGMFDYIEGPAALREAPPWMTAAVKKHGHLMVIHEPNGVVTNGLDMMLNLLFGVSGPPSKLLSLIVAKSSTAVAATDTSILGGATAPVFSGATQNALSKLMTSPAPVASVAGAITGGISFTEADVNASATATFWPLNRLGLVNVAAATNLGLFDVIGNTASQANPYSRTFSVDFGGAGTFTLAPAITITGVRVSTAFPVL